MISRTKTRLSGETVAALTRKHFPAAEIRRIDELADGLFNAVYRISGTGALEKSVVLKVGPSPDAKVLTYERGIMKTEVEGCRLLQGSGVPVPEILAYDGSDTYIPCASFFLSYPGG